MTEESKPATNELVWRREMPESCGWWLFRANPDAKPRVYETYLDQLGTIAIYTGGSHEWFKEVFPEMEWAGPLPLPKSSPNRVVSSLPKHPTEELQARVTELENTLKIVHFELSTMPEKLPGSYAVKASLNHIKKVMP